jgi:hypothetical protein
VLIIIALPQSWISMQKVDRGIAVTGALGAFTLGPDILGDNIAFGSIHSALHMGSTHYLTDAGFTAAVFAAMPGQTIRIASGQMVSLTSAHNIAKQISILCDPGAGFDYPASSGAYIELSGAGSVMSGCRLKGQGSGTAQQALIMNASGERFTKNVVSDFGGSGNGVIEVASGSDLVIDGNQLSGDSDFDIFVNNLTSSAAMHDITITHNRAGEIILHSSGSGSTIRHFTISNNILTSGQRSKVEFCVEVQNLGSALANAFGSIAGNVCHVSADGVDGGYSISGSQIAVTGNIFDSSGETYSIAPIELVVCDHCSAIGNILNDGTAGEGISIDRAAHSEISHNIVRGFKTGSRDYAIHLVVANTASPNASGNIVSGNSITFSTGGTGIGIWQQCNAKGATCNSNTYYGNSFFSDSTPGSEGIVFENDAGTSMGEVLGTNTYQSPANAVNFGSGVSFSQVPPHLPVQPIRPTEPLTLGNHYTGREQR